MDHQCEHEREFGEIDERLKSHDDFRIYARKKFTSICKDINSLEKAPAEKVAKEVSAMKVGIVVAVATIVSNLIVAAVMAAITSVPVP
jgi:hypothetical protein